MKTEAAKPISVLPAAEQLYSLELIEKMCRGSFDLIKEMLQVFVNDLPKSVKEIKSAYQTKDFKTIKNIAHRIKPVLKFYSVQSLEPDVPVIEQLAEHGIASADMEIMIEKLVQVVTAIAVHMQQTILRQQLNQSKTGINNSTSQTTI